MRVGRATSACCMALFVVALLGVAATQHASVRPSRRLIVDTDMGLDDVRAIFAVLADSTIDLEAILTVEGSADLGRATDNLIGLLESTHSGAVRVMMGRESPEIEAPPWRQMANQLGGATFPPPRALSPEQATPAALTRLLEQSRDTEFLALGPLGNLHALEMGHPGGLGLIHTIWIPVRIRDNRISAWNLSYDVEASQSVLASAARVVLIDISGIRETDAVGFLISLEGDSSPVRWIDQLLLNMGSRASHVMLYDEIAVAAIHNPDLLEIDERTYSVRWGGEGAFELVAGSNGNIRVARLLDWDAALAILRKLWERGPVGRPDRPGDIVSPRLLLRSFHGHLGPYVVIGYRMGKLALDELHVEGHFGVSAEVHSPLKPPGSCLIDGVQIGSGCTLGKQNIRVYEAVGPAWAVFESDHGGQVTIRLRPGIPDLIEDLVNRRGVEAAGDAAFEMSPDSLFIRYH